MPPAHRIIFWLAVRVLCIIALIFINTLDFAFLFDSICLWNFVFYVRSVSCVRPNDAATPSLSEFPNSDNLNTLAFFAGVFFILAAVLIFISVVCFTSRRQRNRDCESDKKRGKCPDSHAKRERAAMYIDIIGLNGIYWCFLVFIIFVNDSDISMEMETSLDIQSVAGTESSFKYPKDLEERVCTIEEMVLPPPPPPPSAIVKITTRSSNWESM